MSHVFIQFNAEFSTISLSFSDLLQIFRNCLGNLFSFFFFCWVHAVERPYRNGWPCHIFRLYLLDKFCTAPRRRNVSLGCPSVSATLPPFPCSLCYPVVLVSFGLFGLVVCLAISMEAPALHVINNIISRRQEGDANYVSVSVSVSVFDSSSNYDGLCLLLLPSCCFIVQTW